ncbi:MAG: EAL domain-containing protein [Gammaproteobacteria bacterium]|nr:EAL domain-containing protein [Gammaproteobacteria bacterium]
MTKPLIDKPSPREQLPSELIELRARVSVLETIADEREKARHLQAALYRIADLTSAEMDMPSFYRELHAVVGELMYAKNFAIALYDEQKDAFSFVYFVDTVDELDLKTLASIPAEKMRGSLTGYVLKAGQVVHVDGPAILELERRGELRSMGADSVDWLGIPLKVGDKTIGVLILQTYVADTVYSREDEDLLLFVSQHIATALQRRQLDESQLKAHEELERRVQERTAELSRANAVLERQIAERERAERLQAALFRIADLTSSEAALDEFYRALHAIVGELMYAENFYIALYDRNRDELSFPYFVDRFDKNPPQSVLHLSSDTLTGRVLVQGHPLLVNRENRQIVAPDHPAIGTRSTTWLGIPLQDKAENIGVLVVQSYDENVRFSERDVEVLNFVSQHIATALTRRRDAEELRAAHEQLQQANDELERKVVERTLELSAANEFLQTEIAERRRIETKLLHDALHDALTDLPNRALFTDRLEHAIARRKRHASAEFAVLYLDLDRFKIVNDSLGHLVGDKLLIEVSRRLLTCIRLNDTVARLGGDEFCILVEGTESETDAKIVAGRILSRLTDSFQLGDHQVFISTSIGITYSSFDYSRPEELLRDADTAMYHAKAEGKARYAIFDPALHSQAIDRLKLENDLRQAIENGLIEPYYQPILHLASGRVVGFEALARWQDPVRGPVSPVVFIPIAEETGLIHELGLCILRQACRQLHAWQRQDPRLAELSISVNLSSRQFSAQLLHDIERVLLDTGLAPEHLKLEITESLLMQNFESAREMLDGLRALGAQILLDDFGTGYSSLSYLHRFPLDVLKIDRSFISDLESESQHQVIVRTIRALAASLGLSVVAEGIENIAQCQALEALGCEYGQGYYFARPLAAADAERYLHASIQEQIPAG